MVGPRFRDFIARWEMNIEPPPAEKTERYTVLILQIPSCCLIITRRITPSTPQRWGQGKLLDTAEEDYFNGEDEEEETIHIVSTPPPRGTMKRKRTYIRRKPPFTGMPRMTPFSGLVDYDGDDDLGGSEENIAPTPTPGRDSPLPGGFIPVSYNSTSSEPPSSPRISHRQVSIKSPLSPEEDSDILDALSKGGTSLLPRISGMSDAGLGSKRRRDDDDDELLERLANKSKRLTPSPASPNPESDSSGPVKAIAPTKTPEEGPKKLKLKFGAVGAAVASSASPKSSSPSSTGTKDGDNG